MGIIQTDKAYVLRQYSTPVPGEDVNPGYTFEGWNTMQDGSGTAVPGGSDYSVSSENGPKADITLYAQWKTNGYSSAAFIRPDGSGTRIIAKSGYAAFGGSASQNTFNLSDSRRWVVPYGDRQREVLRVKNAAGAVLWEKYYRVSYDANLDGIQYWTVSFDANGGSGSMDPLEVPKGQSVTLSACTFSPPPGYTIIEPWSYNTAADGTGTPYYVGESLTPSANMVLYAQWKVQSSGGGSSGGGSSGGTSSKITSVNAVAESGVPAGNINYQNKSYGYMVWTGTDLPVWQTSLSRVFGEGKLGQTLFMDEDENSASVTASGYKGETRTTNESGRSGIGLASITPSTSVLYTKVQLSPYIGANIKSENGGSITYQDGWSYDLRISGSIHIQTYGMPYDNRHTNTGKWYMSYGKYFAVRMTVHDSNGDHEFEVSANAQSNLVGWRNTRTKPAPISGPETLTFDFTSALKEEGLSKGAKTTKLEFFEGTSSADCENLAFVNAVCLYKDTLN